MRLHAATLEARALQPGMRVNLGGDWRTVSRVVAGAERVALWLDGRPWPSLSASRWVRASWVRS